MSTQLGPKGHNTLSSCVNSQTDDNPPLQPEKQVQPEKQGSPPEPENPPIREWIGLISTDGFNRVSVIAHDEADARAIVDLELRKRSGALWREWKDNGERCVTDEPSPPETTPEPSTSEKHPVPIATYVSELALDQWREGVNSGISRVVSYVAGRLGSDHPFTVELRERYEGGAK